MTDHAPGSSTIYQQRRQRLLAQMQARGGGVAILTTAPEALRNRDADYPYRHDSSFYYLSGFAEPQAALVLVTEAGHPQGGRSILFCREKHEEREIWDGYRYGPSTACAHFGFDAAYPIDALNTQLPTYLPNQGNLFYALGRSAELDQQIRTWLDAVRAQSRSGVRAPAAAHDIHTLLDEMRLFKDTYELDRMRASARIAAQAHLRAMHASAAGYLNQPGGLREYHLEAELLHTFRHAGAQSVAYNSIVAAGANACVLHYRAGDAVLRDGELCLIDAGCELDSYASDITRTFPVNGRFSGPQRTLYDLVLAAQEAAIALTRPGLSYNAPHDAAVKVLAQGMLDTGLLDASKVGSLDDVIAKGDYRQFYMHRTGHWLGMDVHDVGEYREALPDASGEHPWRLLAPGMVVTIEPGLYVRPAPGVPEVFWNIGIRIEDDAILTASGCELITRDVPVQADAIEAWMRDAMPINRT